MQKQESLTPTDNEFIASLGDFRPTDGAIDRDRLMHQVMYQAGRTSVRCSRLMWQGATLVLAVMMGISLVLTPQQAEQTTGDGQMAEVQPSMTEPVTLGEYDRHPEDSESLKFRRDILAKKIEEFARGGEIVTFPSQTPSEKNSFNQ